jgi:hypothetical protein
VNDAVAQRDTAASNHAHKRQVLNDLDPAAFYRNRQRNNVVALGRQLIGS